MPKPDKVIDTLDARLLMALTADPRATVMALAQRVAASRNTVQARLAGLVRRGALMSFERRIRPSALGYPLTALVTTTVVQRRLDEVGGALRDIPEVVEVLGLSGQTDLLVRVVATDAEDLYRIAGKILATPGVERTNTALVMREMVEYRLTPLLRQRAQGR